MAPAAWPVRILYRRRSAVEELRQCHFRFGGKVRGSWSGPSVRMLRRRGDQSPIWPMATQAFSVGSRCPLKTVVARWRCGQSGLRGRTDLAERDDRERVEFASRKLREIRVNAGTASLASGPSLASCWIASPLLRSSPFAAWRRRRRPLFRQRFAVQKPRINHQYSSQRKDAEVHGDSDVIASQAP